MPPKKPQEKKADAAPKPKPGKDAPNGNGAAEPAAAHAASGAPAHKPDADAYKAEQEKIRSEIEALQTKLNAVKDKIALTNKDGPAAERRAALRAEQDSLRAAQGNNKVSSERLREQIKAIQDNVQKRVQDIQAAKKKAPFKTVAEVDAAIKNLDRQVESGSMAIAQEKRALAEISTYKRARKTIEGFQAEEDAIQAERAKADALRNELNDPEAQALSARYTAIRKELDEIKEQSDAAYADRNKLFDERNALQKEINALHERRRESTQQYRDAHDRYWQKVNEDRARRAEKYRAQRAAEEEEKRKDIIEQIREEARIPAYESQIEDCQTLIDFFGKLLHGGAAAAAAIAEASQLTKADVAGVPKLEIRKVEVDTNLVARKKKGEDEDNYFVGGKTKAKKGAKATTPQPPKETDKNAQLNIPLPTLTALLSLSIPPPASHGEIERTVDDLKTKKTWFEANQRRQTEENVKKGEEKIRQLEAKAQAKAGADANGHSTPPAEETATSSPAPEIQEAPAVEATA
ncbi:hypothetical protein AURDEDRAFT_96166 [Auricularia subglabra TFB-10046 SS5]|nr:hypothetical protein AURDEDRAFT_96166 [Auricularia subglabra TFB-10046 SS5]